jgi:hypothetical protein
LSLPSHALIETTEEEDEKEDDAVQPETSNNVSGLGTTFHGASEREYRSSDATRVESVESVKNTVQQASKPIDTVEFEGSKCDTTLHSISKPNESPAPKLNKPLHNMFNTPPSSSLFFT